MAKTTFRVPSNQAISNQVVGRDGTVSYAPISTNAYAQQSSNAFDQAYANASDYQDKLAALVTQMERDSPLARADAYATERNADANYLQAESAYKTAKTQKDDPFSSAIQRTSPYTQWKRDEKSAANERRFNSQQNSANRELDRFLAGIKKESDLGAADLNRRGMIGSAQASAKGVLGAAESNTKGILGAAESNARAMVDTARINAEKMLESTRIQQPLSAEQILEQSRIENPDPMKSMAMNVLGGYATGQGTRSNFAYWG